MVRTFSIGSSYYPPFHDPDDWARDFARMADAGLNTLRTAELIASWEWIEPARGEFDWSWLDRAFELAESNGLSVLLGTGAGSPPIWLLDEYPDVQIVSQHGVRYPTGAAWGWACLHHPGYRAESKRYLKALLARYSRHPSLLGWQVHNEPCHPSHHDQAGPPDYYCYCQHSAAAFRRWLQARYEDPEALSVAWSCTPTRHRYRSWEQVKPPVIPPTGWGSPGAWLDWRRFVNDSFPSFIEWQDSIIKEADSAHPTTTNLVNLLDADLGVSRATDAWRYAGRTDILGFDLYPIGRGYREPWWVSLQLDYARSPALHAGMPFWIPEIESGPIGQWVLGPAHDTRGIDIRRYDLECIAHGAKLLLYQGYREWDPLPLHWGALVDLNGEPTERYQAAAEVNKVVFEHREIFLESQPPRAQIGILVDNDNAIACTGMGAAEMLLGGIHGVYRAFWEHGYPVEFITPELLAGGRGQGYRLLVLPFVMLVSPECAQAVNEYVAGGGAAVAFAKCGMLDHHSWTWHDRPGGLTGVFGARESWIRRSAAELLYPTAGSPLFAGEPGPLAGAWHRQDFDVDDGTEVAARYADGAPAVLRCSHGAGQAFLFGTHFDVAALADEAVAQRRVLAGLASYAGVVRPVSVKAGRLVDARVLLCGDTTLVLLFNHAAEAVDAIVALPLYGAERPLPRRATDLFSGTEVAVAPESDGAAFTVRLDAYGSTVVLVEPAAA